MTLPLKIEFQPINFKCAKVLEVRQVTLEIQEDYARQIEDYLIEEPTNYEDLKMPWKEARVLSDFVFFKKDITGIEMHNRVAGPKGHKYCVCIDVGSGAAAKFYFNTNKEAYDIHIMLMQWWLPNFIDNKYKKEIIENTNAND